MNDLERRALLGDAEAQRECTRSGILLPCPICGNANPAWGECKIFEYVQCLNCGLYIRICGEKRWVSAKARWNTRQAPPIGRCGECKHYSENKKRCDHPKIDWDIECYDCWIEKEPDGFCNDFEPKGGESDG